MTDQKKTNLSNADTWIRLLYMLLFCGFLFVTRFVIWTIAALQYLLVLILGSDNRNLRNFGQGLGKWVYQILMFLTFNTEQKPFPFDEWPVIEETPGVILAADEEADEPPDSENSVNKSNDNGDDVPAFTEVSETGAGEDDESRDDKNQ